MENGLYPADHDARSIRYDWVCRQILLDNQLLMPLQKQLVGVIAA